MSADGEVYLVGAGPGDPRLITVKGLELLRQADVIVYDYLAGEELLKEVKKGAELIDVGKKGGCHKVKQDGINDIIVAKAKEGKKVVRLKGGDPFMFGRGGEEAEELRKHGVAVHVVPGVTSAIAAPALAGVPVTHRDHASFVTFVTGHESDSKEEDIIDWKGLAQLGGTIVILMGMGHLEKNMGSLIDGGLDPSTPVAVVHRGSTPAQRSAVGTASDIAARCREQNISSPAVVVVGSVARLKDVLGDLR
ncbi:uroporphyrinogen-III C-methyltransferase [Methanomassiliicoccus luminyensis]|uniref:uroporphyrinogen-III C-methyltransferase n=1 Tax=Methanomassiliicoccus luminyensis TaxID=1080712 RepID=UPI00037ABC7A|nr:uroporphyrinogen-III C-methyltransferase [Methanomassiliicoccus luminyensis]